MTPKLLRWLAPMTVVGVIGCGSKPPAEAPGEPVTLAPVIAPPVTDDGRGSEQTKPTPPSEAVQPAKPAGPPVVLPADTGGKAVAKALVVPPPLSAETPPAIKPKPYSSALDRGELPLPTVAPKPFNPAAPKASAAKPSPPAEKHPPATLDTTLPEGRDSDRPLVKAPAPPNARAADVPMQAWKQGDRASLEDPTADLSAGRVIETPLPVNTAVLPFLRMTIPNPFELSEQLRGKLGKDVELGVMK